MEIRLIFSPLMNERSLRRLLESRGGSKAHELCALKGFAIGSWHERPSIASGQMPMSSKNELRIAKGKYPKGKYLYIVLW